MIGFTLVGNWIGASNALAALPVELHSSALWGQRKAAEKLVKIVKGHINNQDLGWEPLASSTNSGDPRILVDTEAYLNSIKAWRKNSTYHAGVPDNAYNHKGVKIAYIAEIHEFGYDIVPRPLWGPSIDELGGEEGVRDIVSAAIFSKIHRMRAAGFSVNKIR